MVPLVRLRHVLFIYSLGNSNINSIITSVKITGQAAQMIKHQEERSSVIYLEYVLPCVHCENYQCLFHWERELLRTGGLVQGDSSLTMSEASP